jgi:hypothetical protein
VVSAVLLGVAVDVLTGGVTKGLRRLRLRWASSTALQVDTSADGLFMLGEWSPVRQLHPHRLSTIELSKPERPVQGFVDEEVFAGAVARCHQDTGEIAYVTSFRLDHRESPETQVCRVTLAASDYAEVRAIELLRQTAPLTLSQADQALQHNASEYVKRAVPSSVAINVIPMSQDQELLCARRSAAVDNGVGMWTVGVFETMKRADPNRPGQPEDFYALGQRALLEEVGLNSHDYGDLNVSWVGIYKPLLRGHIVASVRLRISKEEALEHARMSDSSYEHDRYDWIPLNRATVRSFAAAKMRPSSSGGGTLNIDEREWLEQARLAVLEAWRFRVVLQD